VGILGELLYLRHAERVTKSAPWTDRPQSTRLIGPGGCLVHSGP